MSHLPLADFDSLSIDEQIEYVQSLWDRIAASPGQVPVPDWHLATVKERLLRHRENPGDAKPWEEVRSEIEKKLGK